MANIRKIKEHMEVIGADGVHIGTVDKVEGGRIKLIKADSGSHKHHHHYVSTGLVATIEGDKVRLSANGDAAVLLEEERGGERSRTVGCGTGARSGSARLRWAWSQRWPRVPGSGGARAARSRTDRGPVSCIFATTSFQGTFSLPMR